MSEDELYVTCVCATLVNEASMAQHIKDCFLEDFIKNLTSLKISKPRSYGDQPPKARHVCGKCIRCRHPMYKDEGTLITLYPSIPDSVVMCCSYRNKSGEKHEINESICKSSNDFHQERPENENPIVDCIDSIVNSVLEKEKAEKCWQQKTVISKFLENLPHKVGSISGSEDTSDSDDRDDKYDKDISDSEGISDHEHSVLYDEISSGTACRSFHLALLPNCNKDDVDSNYRSYSLLLQILDTLHPRISAGTQTDLPTTIDFGVQVKILGVYPEEIQNLLSTGKENYDVPELDPTAEAAFQSHLSSLIPCRHCSRTFSPDRIQVHMSCCIERPRTRECVTPTEK